MESSSASTKEILSDLDEAEMEIIRALKIASETSRLFEKTPFFEVSDVEKLSEEYLEMVDKALERIMKHSVIIEGSLSNQKEEEALNRELTLQKTLEMKKAIEKHQVQTETQWKDSLSIE